jgi:hypothetical protein
MQYSGQAELKHKYVKLNAVREHAWVKGGLNICIQGIAEYINVIRASCLGKRGIKYIYTWYCRIY